MILNTLNIGQVPMVKNVLPGLLSPLQMVSLVLFLILCWPVFVCLLAFYVWFMCCLLLFFSFFVKEKKT